MSFADPRAPRAPVPGESPSSASRRLAREAASARRSAMRRETDEERPVERPRGASYRRTVSWQRLGLVSAGLVVGALLGAGTALLLAPQTGRETRIAIGRRAKSARYRAADAWDDLADELTAVARRGRRRARRALTRAKWRATDAIA